MSLRLRRRAGARVCARLRAPELRSDPPPLPEKDFREGSPSRGPPRL